MFLRNKLLGNPWNAMMYFLFLGSRYYAFFFKLYIAAEQIYRKKQWYEKQEQWKHAISNNQEIFLHMLNKQNT